MPSWLTDMFSREISSKIALPILVLSALTLFAPNDYAKILGIDGFRSEYRLWIGAAFVLSSSALVTNAIWSAAIFLKPWVSGWVFVQTHKKNLHSLTSDEKAILRLFIIDGESTVYEDANTGAINLLVNKHIAYRASNLSLRMTRFAYILHPWAREYLEKNRRLLE